jgi:hypothetical protein
MIYTIRLVSLGVFVWLAVCGCSSDGSRSARQGSEATKPEGATGKSRAGGSRKASPVRIDESIWGRVVSVNPTLRFVVLDFPIRKMPGPEQLMGVYRDGQKVGELKVTGPAHDTTIAAEITAGEARIGDEVRED